MSHMPVKKTMSATPGPWHVDGYQILDAKDRNIVWEMGSVDYDANARLIAAAPDLLASLKQLIEDTDLCACKGEHDDLHVARAQEVVAKVEGRS